MKRFVVVLCFTLSIALVGAATCHAASFTSSLDFSGDGTDSGHTYQIIRDSPVYSYTQIVTFTPAALQITSAELTLTYSKVNSGGEVWWVDAGGNATSLGRLDSSSGWDTQDFTIPTALFSGISGNTWSLKITFDETTSGSDSFWLDKSVLDGCYTPDPSPGQTPEPGTMLLLGTGIVGLLGFRKKFTRA